MKRLSLEDLAGILAKNPDLRLHSDSRRILAPQDVLGEKATLTPQERVKAIRTDISPPRKYRNQPIEVDGVRYDSKKEMQRGMELTLMERAGQIKHLERQVSISLDINGVHICKYRADFKYQEKQADGTWRIVIEDVKGFLTREYKIKRNLVRGLMGIQIRET